MNAQQQLAELLARYEWQTANEPDERMEVSGDLLAWILNHGPAIAELIEAAKAANALYGHVWDRTDGCLVVFPDNVKRFDETYERLHESIAKLTEPK